MRFFSGRDLSLSCALLCSAAALAQHSVVLQPAADDEASGAVSIAGSALAGAQHANLSGVVTDSSGAAVPNATVSLEDAGGNVVATTVTDGRGHYELHITGPLAARYRERVTAEGFRAAVQENVSLVYDVERFNNVRLRVGDTTETVTVTPNETKGNGEIATAAQAGILGTLSLDELPFSVSSYTGQLVRDQQAQTESDVLRNEVGIQEGNGRYSEDQYMTLRGFVLNPGQSLLNGIPGLVDVRSPSIENVDRIEIFKGPTSFINGASAYGVAGGVVNMVTKRAGDEPYYRFDGGYSSNTELEGHLDVGRRFLPEKALGVRLMVGGREGDTPVDKQQEHVGDGDLAVDYRGGQKLHASVDVSVQSRSMLASRDSIYVSAGIAVPKAPSMTSNLFDHSSSYTHHDQLVLAQARYDANEHFSLYGSFGYNHQPESYIGPGYDLLTNTDAEGNYQLGGAVVQDLTFNSDTHNQAARLGAQVNASAFGIHHQITLAADYLQVLAAYFYEYGDNVYQTNIYNPIALAPLDPRTTGIKQLPDTNLNRLSSVALADVATAFGGRLIVIGGLRGQWIGTKEYGTVARGASDTAVFTACTSACSYNQGVPSPSIAALYHLPHNFSVYGNYVQDLQQGPSAAGTGAINQNQVFAPFVAKQEEAGLRYEHRSLETGFAIFQITKPNGVLNPTTNTFGVTGEQRNRGLELTLSGNVARDLRLNGGISFMDARQRGTGDSTTEGKRAEGIPATELTVNAEWTVPGLRSRSLNLDARVTASSQQSVDVAQTQSIPAWARLDLGGRYEFHTKLPTSIRVNIDNVTGANYWESGLLGLAYTGPRAVRISSGLRF